MTTNYIPAGSTLLHVTTAGLPLVPPTGSKITHLYYGDPVFRPPGLSYRKMWGFNFEVDEMAYPYFTNAGILGSNNYVGGWTIEIDIVNWHSSSATYYPPPDGLLLGESYHVVPGTAARSGISYTEDAALSRIFIGHSMGLNHLGPYSQVGAWLLPNPPAGGSSSGAFLVNIGQSGNQIPEFPRVPTLILLGLTMCMVLLRCGRLKRRI